MYSSKTIANTLLEIAKRKKSPLSPMKLQKLVYFAHGWHLALEGKPLLNEQIEAWSFGPVINSLYQEYKRFGADPIDVIDYNDVLGEGHEIRALLERIWEVYGRYSAYQLSNLTHQKDTPWYQVYKEYGEEIPLGTDIPKEKLKAYFTKKMERNEKMKEAV